MNKRGQITIFIIIGILLVFSSGMVFFIRNQTSSDNIDASIKSSVSKVPLNALPVKEFIDTCLRQVSIEGLNYVGYHGGYNNYSRFKSGIQIDSEMIDEVPFWYFIEDCSSKEYGCSRSLQPGIESSSEYSLINELSDYVEQNFLTCINNFKVFENQFKEITIDDSPKVTVLVREKDVYFKLDFPVTIINNKDTVKARDFVQSIRVDLKNIYEFANELVKAESESGFLERNVLNLMAPYRGDELPPFYEMISGDNADPGKGWFYRDVKKIIEEDILEQMIPMIKFSNTNMAVPMGSPETTENTMENEITYGFWSSLSKPIGSKRYNNLLVELEYVPDSMYLSLNDGQQFITSENLFDSLSGQGMAQIVTMLFSPFVLIYRTSYDMVVPIIVTVTDVTADKASFDSQGYSFRFAMELNIRNNKEYNDKIELESFSDIKKFNLLNDKNLFPEKEFNITVIDAFDKKSISNAYIEAFCGNKHSIGVTDDLGKIVSRLPSCSAGGFLRVTKTGYSSDPVPYKNDANTEGHKILLPLWRIVQKEVRVHKIIAKEIVVGNLPIDDVLDVLTLGVNDVVSGNTNPEELLPVLAANNPAFRSQISAFIRRDGTSYNEKIERYKISVILYDLVKSAGESVGAAFFPVGTIIVAAVNLAETILETQNLRFPIPTEEYEAMVLSSGNYKIVDIESPLINETAMIVFDREAHSYATRVPMINIIKTNGSDGKIMIDLVPGNYSLDLTLIYDNNVTFPEQHICGKSEFMKKMCNSFGVDGVIEEKNLSSWIEAQQQLNVLIKPNELYSENKKYFDIYIISNDLPTGWFDLPSDKTWERLAVLREKWISGLK